jgi:CelD/BcsL family acetyltransferase involved in cellulose biosynthesis
VNEAAADPRLLGRWAELEANALEPNPFLAPQLVLPAARHLEDGRAARLLVAEQGGELRFLLPVSGPPGLRRTPIAGLRPWLHDYCFLGTPLLAADGDPDRVWAAVIDHLRRHSPAPVLVIPLHPTQGPVAASLHRADLAAGLGIRRGPAANRGFVVRRPEPTYAREWMSRKHLANMARRRRHLAKSLDSEVVTVDRAAGAVEAAVEQFLALESKGWKGRSRTALSCRSGHDRFFREMCQGFADQGRLMFLSLEAGPRVVAQNTALVAGEGLFGFKRAYDEEFARWSPGSLLDLDVLDWFHRSAPLAWLDTCSAPDDGNGSRAFGDRRPLSTVAVPLSPVGAAAAAMVPAGVRARRYVRGTRAGQLVRQRRLARKKG